MNENSVNGFFKEIKSVQCIFLPKYLTRIELLLNVKSIKRLGEVIHTMHTTYNRGTDRAARNCRIHIVRRAQHPHAQTLTHTDTTMSTRTSWHVGMLWR